jgi:alkylation response protein AidB-like acyl-CoA dehydrogenase
MEYGFNEIQLEIRELAQQIAEKYLRPHRAQLDEEEAFPIEIIKALAQSDMMGIYIEEQYGGLGGGCMELCIATEELSKVCAGVAISYAANALGAYPIILFGTEEQKKKYLPSIASGEHLAAFALTEPNVGSDAGSIECTAREEGDYYILNGTKQWITNGGYADVLTVFALTAKGKGARGISAFIVEKDFEGFIVGSKEKKLGIRCSDTRELRFENCKVPKENLLGRKNRGFRVAMTTFEKSRPGIGAQAVGIAAGALDEAINFAQTRIQFGQPVTGFQAIQHMMADCGMQVEAARLLVHHAARAVDTNAPDSSKLSAMAKTFASDAAMKVTVDAVQICGGNGYMREYPFEKFMRDAKITQIYEGTNQIQRTVIGMEMIKEITRKKKKK